MQHMSYTLKGSPSPPSPAKETDRDTGSEPDRGGTGKRIVVCKTCGRAVTTPQARIAVNGSHKHVFCNPHGIVFETACFSIAPGTSALGSPSTEFSWFAGYSWQIAICTGCAAHIGWKFIGPSPDAFYGLIVQKIEEIEETDQ